MRVGLRIYPWIADNGYIHTRESDVICSGAGKRSGWEIEETPEVESISNGTNPYGFDIVLPANRVVLLVSAYMRQGEALPDEHYSWCIWILFKTIYGLRESMATD
jgi:hypothetical protein